MNSDHLRLGLRAHVSLRLRHQWEQWRVLVTSETGWREELWWIGGQRHNVERVLWQVISVLRQEV